MWSDGVVVLSPLLDDNLCFSFFRASFSENVWSKKARLGHLAATVLEDLTTSRGNGDKYHHPRRKPRDLRSAMYCDHDATDRPEHAIFTASYVPQPLAFGHAPDNGGGHGKMEGCHRGDIGGMDSKNQADCECRFYGGGYVHPNQRRLEPGFGEKFERFGGI